MKRKTANRSILHRVESLEALAGVARPVGSFADLAAEVRALTATGIREDDLAELLRRLDEGHASKTDFDLLAGCSVDTLRAVVSLNACS